jgi:hypothetical protein
VTAWRDTGVVPDVEVPAALPGRTFRRSGSMDTIAFHR